MEMELQRLSLDGYRTVYQGTFSQEETLESIVPDACPDIARIVSAAGTAWMKEKESGDGAVRITGTARVTVLYMPEGDGGIQTMEVSIPFQCTRTDPAVKTGDPLRASVQVASADARTLNPRKVLVRVNLTAWAAVSAPDTLSLSGGVDGAEGLEQLQTPGRVCQIAAVSEKPFVFSDVLQPPASRPEMEQLLHTRAEMGTVEAKFIGKKLVLKGEVLLTALYLAGGSPNTVRFELPYSQVLDLGEVPEEAEPDTIVVLKSADCKLQDGDLDITVEALAQTVLWTHRAVTVLQDAYSVGAPVDVSRTQLEVCTGAERLLRREQAHSTAPCGIPMRQVLDCWAAVSGVSAAPAEGGIEFTADLHTAALCLTEEEAYLAVEDTIPVRCRMDLSPDAACTCRCRPIGEVSAVPISSGIEFRLEVEFTLTLCQEKRIPCVSALSPGAAAQDVNRPSVVIRRVASGESLWDIAKACASTVQEICGANGLSGEEIPAGTLLLIPAKRG